jgi:hypothetical protein
LLSDDDARKRLESLPPAGVSDIESDKRLKKKGRRL